MNITVFNVDVIPGEEQAELVFTLRVDGADALSAHVVPIETLENTAAEYDLDPGDVDTILDVVLYGPYLPADKVAADHPKFLFNADTVAQARQHLLATVAEAKGDGKVISVAGDSPEQALAEGAPRLTRSGSKCPVTFVKECAPIDRAVIAEKRKLVDTYRVEARNRRRQRAERDTQATNIPLAASTEERIARTRALRERGPDGGPR